MLFAKALKSANVDDLLTNIAAAAPAGGAAGAGPAAAAAVEEKKEEKKEIEFFCWKICYVGRLVPSSALEIIW